jgi:NAD(P)-dependent dehydrogenase (short-subunit alcohol dehydrogenase family)
MASFKNSPDHPDSLRALVVGGSGGIGRRICQALASAGVNLVIHGRNRDKLAALATELDPAPTELLEADLSGGVIPAQLEEAARRSDILVLAYGPFAYRSLALTSSEDWRNLVLANLALPGGLVSIAAPAMAARGFGRIVLFGGTKTELPRGFRMNAAYASAKTGLGVLARSVAAEYAGNNVACTVVCPGMVDTEYLDPAHRQRFARLAPGGRLTAPERVAGFVVNLLLGDMALVNGSVINTDDGLHLGS